MRAFSNQFWIMRLEPARMRAMEAVIGKSMVNVFREPRK